ncbi:MAG: Gfo/Idh/MocA family oxidoreductase [Planctomycetota bacterium]|nr:Gfo/Idh/MocA family oxidoreductase [Planctomycetota bacterium]
MPETAPAGVAIVGCGNISNGYARCIREKPDALEIIGAFDALPEKTEAFCAEFGGDAFSTLEDLLADDRIEIVINLTIHTAHAGVTKQALLADKHVHSEKPLATDRDSGREVVELAREKGLVLSCSPFVILGEAPQTLWKAVRDGLVGDVVAVSAEMFWGRIEAWHPNPVAFYSEGAGPMLDVGVYPLNILTSILGPVCEVRGLAEITMPEREIVSGDLSGEKFKVTTPDVVYGLLTFANGAIGRLTTTFSPWLSQQAGMELHGTKGSLSLASNHGFNAPVKLATYPDREWKEIPHIREPYAGVDWARGVLDTVSAIREGRPSRVSGEQAFHILDICLSILEASAMGSSVKVESTFQSQS